MKLSGWSQMNPTERRALIAAILCCLCAVVCGVLVFQNGIQLCKWLFDAALAGMFVSLGITDLRRHTAQAVGEFLIAAGIIAVGIAVLA